MASTENTRLYQKARAAAIQKLIRANKDQYDNLFKAEAALLGYEARPRQSSEQVAARKAAHAAEVAARKQARVDARKARLQAQIDALSASQTASQPSVVSSDPFAG